MLNEIKKDAQARMLKSIDALRHTRFRPEGPPDVGPFAAHVAAHEPSVGRQRARDGKRAVARERADLERTTRAEQTRQQREEARLVGADLHARLGQARGLLAQAPRDVAFARAHGAHVLVERGRQQRAVIGHIGLRGRAGLG